MKVFALAISQQGTPPKVYISNFDLSSFSFFNRGTVQEAMNFFLQILVERTKPGDRHTVQEQSYVGHTYVLRDGLAASIICDKELFDSNV
jgi:synaptobrevin family protein YKT6